MRHPLRLGFLTHLEGVGDAKRIYAETLELLVAALLSPPAELTQAVLVPVAYYTGDDFAAARRQPAHERTHGNGWGSSVAIEDSASARHGPRWVDNRSQRRQGLEVNNCLGQVVPG
jgi:hypothetical protein